MNDQTPLTAFLSGVFPRSGSLDGACWVRQAIEGGQDDLREALELVRSSGGLDSLSDRVRVEHPIDRAHRREYDDRLLDILITETEAFAWAATNLGSPVFVQVAGSPDLYVADTATWVEAKSVHLSDAEKLERRALDRTLQQEGIAVRGIRELGPIPDAVFRKMAEQTDDALKKLERQAGGQLVVYFKVELDFGTTIRDAPTQLTEWAQEKANRARIRIVLSRGRRDWRSPLADVNPK